MKNLVLTLIIGVSFCANVGFAATNSSTALTDSVKAKKLLEGQVAADKLAGQQKVAKDLGVDKSSKVLGSFDNRAEKEAANKKRKEAARLRQQAEEEAAMLRAQAEKNAKKLEESADLDDEAAKLVETTDSERSDASSDSSRSPSPSLVENNK